MASGMDAAGHLLSLKVMRISRPALATAWEPFYSSSPSFSAHSTASVLSLQGKQPLTGHPKTLRDLTNASELLTLPAAFGAIQLGETFSGALAVNNETASSVDGVLLRVEMQTANNKIILAEIGGQAQTLAAGDTLETVVQHEIKELGQHVLACTVTYKLPPGSRMPPAAVEGGDPSIQSFRKFYKFAVTNPLSVKTKVHVPRAPSAVISREERDKVFLEIHIQNTTLEPMSFERIALDPAPGWKVGDSELGDIQDKLFSGGKALMQPQDARQYLYVLTPIEPPQFYVPPEPGAVIQLGRLDISWRSAFGEPGRLLTSMLSRRIPLIAPVTTPQSQTPAARPQPGSALPLHLQRSASMAATPPSRPNSPGPSTPIPYQPASPRVRPTSIPARPQTPSTTTSTTAVSVSAPTPMPPTPLLFDLVALNPPSGPVSLDMPVQLCYKIGVMSPTTTTGRRTVTLAVQHVVDSTPSSSVHSKSMSVSTAPTPSATSTATSPRPAHAQFGSVGSAQLTRTLSLPVGPGAGGTYRDERPSLDPFQAHQADGALSSLPPPLASPTSAPKPNTGARPLGSSLQILPPLILLDGTPSWSEFTLTWIPIKRGFVQLGGLRVFVVKDEDEGAEKDGVGASTLTGPLRVSKEWDVVVEVWVS